METLINKFLVLEWINFCGRDALKPHQTYLTPLALLHFFFRLSSSKQSISIFHQNPLPPSNTSLENKYSILVNWKQFSTALENSFCTEFSVVLLLQKLRKCWKIKKNFSEKEESCNSVMTWLCQYRTGPNVLRIYTFPFGKKSDVSVSLKKNLCSSWKRFKIVIWCHLINYVTTFFQFPFLNSFFTLYFFPQSIFLSIFFFSSL